MGCCGSTVLINNRDHLFNRSKEIDKVLHKDFLNSKKQHKILLLGAGESGKSTIIKQCKIIYNSLQPFTFDERLMYKQQIHSNVINGIWITIDTIYDELLPLNENNVHLIQLLESIPTLFDYESLPPIPINFLKGFWDDNSVQLVYKDCHKFAIPENLDYWFDNLDRVWNEDFIPNNQDILTCRAKSIGIVETTFHINGFDYRLLDVGGQRSERKKWIHCFEGVTTIIFVAALSSYDQALEEDIQSNQMQESLLLFDSICNSRWFIFTSMIVFLNKNDLFVKKIPKLPLRTTEYFSDYDGDDDDVDGSRSYFKHRFLSLNRNKNKEIYVHTTNAMDTRYLSKIMTSVTE